jgi:hypothetical protein
MYGRDSWHDWVFSDHRPGDAERSMRELARYANPEQVRRQGIGLGGTDPDGTWNGQGHIAKAELLAQRLAGTGIRYTMEPFNPRHRNAGGGQIVRTTPELLEGSGTCLDFAVSLAALCVSEGIPVILAYATPADDRLDCHAFVVVQEAGDDEDWQVTGRYVYTRATFKEWAKALTDEIGPVWNGLIDATPLPDGSGDMAARRTATMELLQRCPGIVHAVHVQSALDSAGVDWLALPEANRNFGITGWIPDPPADLTEFPTRVDLLKQLAGVTGGIVLVGDRGTGKSTVALQLALERGKGRGWYLDSSDRETLLRSFAAVEAQCSGRVVGNEQSENITTLAAAARRRLAERRAPWIVVIDNADRPASIAELLPVPRGEQLLIVTTTDRKWVDGLPGDHWRVTFVDTLQRDDLDTATRQLSLHDDELLPGLVRIARACDPDLLAASMTEPPGVTRLVRAALGGQPGEPLLTPTTPLVKAVVAASFMPAEQITVGWLAAVFDGDREASREATRQAQWMGLIEHSRYAWGNRHNDEVPLWMHRLVRQAIRSLADRRCDRLGLEVLAEHRTGQRPQRYSVDELTELVDFLHAVGKEQPWPILVPAATAVMNLLEPLGSRQNTAAAALARIVLPHADVSTMDGLDMHCRALMALARPVNQNDSATIEEIDEAIQWCRLAAASCGAADDRERKLLRGRADAMHGILLKKKVTLRKKTGAQGPHSPALRQVIDILRRSYELRRAALTSYGQWGQPRLMDDPEQHVDRGWYNVGGAYMALVNVLVDEDPDAVADAVAEALRAYLGSLSLRRSHGDTKYTAASLWGSALALYMAALHCPGRLDLRNLTPTPEVDPVVREQTGVTLLRAAEDCVLQALRIWALIDGAQGQDTNKARMLHRKISLAWAVIEPPQTSWPSAIRKAIGPFLADLRLSWVDLHAGESR